MNEGKRGGNMTGQISLEERVYLSKNDINEKNKLIQEYIPFIRDVTHQKIGRFIVEGRDEELSIAMLGFEEAIDKFDETKGRFINFARMIINFRLTDYYRKNKGQSKILSLDIDNREDILNSLDIDEAIKRYEMEEENSQRANEIAEFNRDLKKWNITLADLVKHSPKQKKLRDYYKEMAYFIYEDEELLNELLKSKHLPIKKIKEKRLVPQKKLERGRIYIIGLIIILNGDYDFISEYIQRR